MAAESLLDLSVLGAITRSNHDELAAPTTVGDTFVTLSVEREEPKPDAGQHLPPTEEPHAPSEHSGAVPAFVTDFDRRALKWIFDQLRTTGCAPTRQALLIHFRVRKQDFHRLQYLNLVTLRDERVVLTRNGLRATGDGAARAQLSKLDVILQSAKEYWLSTREPIVSVEYLATACDLDIETTQQVVSLAPLRGQVSYDPDSLMPMACPLDDNIVDLDARRCASPTWEYKAPTCETELIGRFIAGEKEFQTVDILERLNPRFNNDHSPHHLGHDLSGLVIRGGRLCAISFQRCNLNHAIFENVALDGSLFFECTLRGATFRGVTVAATSLVACDLEGIRVDQGGLPGAFVELSSFSTATQGLRDRVLAVSYWDRVLVNEGWIDRSWLSREPSGAEGASNCMSVPTAADRTPVVEVGASADAVSPTAACPRLQLRRRPNSKMLDVLFDGEMVGEIEGDRVGARLLGLVLAYPDFEHHALDLHSTVNGQADLYLGTSERAECRRLIQELELLVTLPGELSRERRLRTGALLRRLEVVRRELAQGEKRSKGWDAAREVEQLEFVLRIANYEPKSHGDGGDPIARVRARLRRAYEDVRGKLIAQHPDLRAHLKVSFRYEEFWVYESSKA